MGVCQFIYQRSATTFNRGYQQRENGQQCSNTANFSNGTLCGLHRKRIVVQNTGNDERNSFPRLYSSEEERRWVNEARRRTDFEVCLKRGCVICGQRTDRTELKIVSEDELMKARGLLSPSECYEQIPKEEFMYRGYYNRFNGMILDPAGFLNEDEIMEGSPFIARMCTTCHSSLHKRSLPSLALANNLWTGVGCIAALEGLNWIEEKLLSRVHVSVQVQKCRMRGNFRWDSYHPQRRLKGHIISYPVDPTMVLNKLPLTGEKLNGLVKIIFVSRHKRMSLQEASKLRFFLIRRDKYRRALEWLILNNPLYKDVQVDHSALEKLPIDGIMPEVYECITFCNKMKDNMKGHSRYDEVDDDDDDNSGTSPMI
jgi:hypothetical protein